MSMWIESSSRIRRLTFEIALSLSLFWAWCVPPHADDIRRLFLLTVMSFGALVTYNAINLQLRLLIRLPWRAPSWPLGHCCDMITTGNEWEGSAFHRVL